jgi:hypothetical protein
MSKHLSLLPPVFRTVSMKIWFARVSVAEAFSVEPAFVKFVSSFSASKITSSFLPAKKGLGIPYDSHQSTRRWRRRAGACTATLAGQVSAYSSRNRSKRRILNIAKG